MGKTLQTQTVKYFPEVTEIAIDQWRVEDNFRVTTSDVELLIPGGFETDLASIPRPLWNIIAPFELGLAGPIVHDWLYRHGGRIQMHRDEWRLSRTGRYTRKDADGVLHDIMKQDGVSSWRVWSAYHAVRLFGGSSWKP